MGGILRSGIFVFRHASCFRFLSFVFVAFFSLSLSQFVCLCDAPPQAMKIRHVKRGLISVFMAKTQHQGTHTTHTHSTIGWHLQHAYNVVMAAPPSSNCSSNCSAECSVWRLGIPNFIAVHCKIFAIVPAAAASVRFQATCGGAGLFL